jgi:SAM-dependent methyltransferase
MFALDPGAALRECRRVLRPRGRLALAVWDAPERNPWATIPSRALVELGYAEPPDPDAPGMFTLASAERLQDLLEEAGFVEVTIDAVAVEQRAPSLDVWLEERADLSRMFAAPWARLDTGERDAVRRRIGELLEPYTDASGALNVPGVSLVALAE